MVSHDTTHPRRETSGKGADVNTSTETKQKQINEQIYQEARDAVAVLQRTLPLIEKHNVLVPGLRLVVEAMGTRQFKVLGRLLDGQIRKGHTVIGHRPAE
jgi:hypothetical protein